MMKLCPNYDREDALETVLEVPMPEEIFGSSYNNGGGSWQNMKSYWTKSTTNNTTMTSPIAGQNPEIQFLLGVVGAPLIPFPVHQSHTDSVYDHPVSTDIKDQPIEASMAKYIVKQYIAAVGGERAFNAIESMYAMGKVRMVISEYCEGEEDSLRKKLVKVKSYLHNNNTIGGEIGGFVLWQKGAEHWCLEMVASGCKISAGSDGKVAWRQTPWHHSHASRGPPRPLRRFLQGLDPKSTAYLFNNAICIGEKRIEDEDCFNLKLEAEPSALEARSSSNVEIMKHTVWGCFSQRTGLLVQLEDTHVLRITSSGKESVFWETTMESLIYDYRTIEGVQIAHGGRTIVSLFRFGENSDNHSRTKMEEDWEIEEVDFNIMGLSMDCFLAPSDLKKEEEGCSLAATNTRLPLRIRTASSRISSSKIIAIEVDDESDGDEDFLEL